MLKEALELQIRGGSARTRELLLIGPQADYQGKTGYFVREGVEYKRLQGATRGKKEGKVGKEALPDLGAIVIGLSGVVPSKLSRTAERGKNAQQKRKRSDYLEKKK